MSSRARLLAVASAVALAVVTFVVLDRPDEKAPEPLASRPFSASPAARTSPPASKQPSPTTAPRRVRLSVVSVSTSGEAANGSSANSDHGVSFDGRFIAFWSAASNLVSGDANRATDVFVRDRRLGKTQLVSLSSAGEQANGPSYLARISADGRFVVFISEATNLVRGRPADGPGYFIRDRRAATTARVPMPEGTDARIDFGGDVSISADGHFVAFNAHYTDPPEQRVDSFRYDRLAGVTERVATRPDGEVPAGTTGGTALSNDGRYVAFAARDESALAPGDTNGKSDVFVRDFTTGTVTRVSLRNDGTQLDGFATGASISDDGNYVAFQTDAPNAGAGGGYGGKVFVADRKSRKLRPVPLSKDRTHAYGVISAGGRYLPYFGGANEDPTIAGHIYLADVRDQTFRSIAVADYFAEEYPYSRVTPAMSGNASVLVFTSRSSKTVPGNGGGVFAADLA